MFEIELIVFCTRFTSLLDFPVLPATSPSESDHYVYVFDFAASYVAFRLWRLGIHFTFWVSVRVPVLWTACTLTSGTGIQPLSWGLASVHSALMSSDAKEHIRDQCRASTLLASCSPGSVRLLAWYFTSQAACLVFYLSGYLLGILPLRLLAWYFTSQAPCLVFYLSGYLLGVLPLRLLAWYFTSQAACLVFYLSGCLIACLVFYLSGYLLGVLPLRLLAWYFTSKASCLVFYLSVDKFPSNIFFRVWLHCLVSLASWSPIELTTCPSVRTAFSSSTVFLFLDTECLLPLWWTSVLLSPLSKCWTLCVSCFCLAFARKSRERESEVNKFFCFFPPLFLSFPGKVHHTLKVTDKHRGERKTTDEVTGRLISFFWRPIFSKETIAVFVKRLFGNLNLCLDVETRLISVSEALEAKWFRVVFRGYRWWCGWILCDGTAKLLWIITDTLWMECFTAKVSTSSG